MNAAQFSRQRARIAREAKQRRGFGPNALRKLVREARAVTIVRSRRIVGWRLPDDSVVCVKHRYQAQGDAIMDMLGIQAEYGKRGLPRRAYQCDFCGGWHLTSQISIKEDD